MLIPVMFPEISSPGPNPSTVVALTLAIVSGGAVISKAAYLVYRVQIARRIAEELDFLVSSKRAWEVSEQPLEKMEVKEVDRFYSALKVLSRIDLAPYFADRKTRNLIDNSLAILLSQLHQSRIDR